MSPKSFKFLELDSQDRKFAWNIDPITANLTLEGKFDRDYETQKQSSLEDRSKGSLNKLSYGHISAHDQNTAD